MTIKKYNYVFGRPTKYEESMCARVVDLMSKGKFICHVCAEFYICKDTFWEWLKVHQNFSDSYKIGRVFCEQHWLDFGRDYIITDKETNFNQKIFDRIVRCQFRDEWSDNHEFLQLDKFEGSLKEQTEVLDRALKSRTISVKHYDILMNSLRVKSDIINNSEIEARLKALEETITKNN